MGVEWAMGPADRENAPRAFVGLFRGENLDEQPVALA